MTDWDLVRGCKDEDRRGCMLSQAALRVGAKDGPQHDERQQKSVCRPVGQGTTTPGAWLRLVEVRCGVWKMTMLAVAQAELASPDVRSRGRPLRQPRGPEQLK